MDFWLGPDASQIVSLAKELSQKTLDVYRVSHERIEEERNSESEVARGAYHDRQLFELIQNGADALVEASSRGRVEVVLTETALYCANEGAPLDRDGVTALLHSYMSRKHGAQIGHFGVGFKSVLAVTDQPRFYSRSGSFGFDRARAERLVRQVVPDVQQVAVLRLPHALDPTADADADRELGALMDWATTVVVLPYREATRELLAREVNGFPAEFLLFTSVVEMLRLENKVEGSRRILTAQVMPDGSIELSDGDHASAWRVFSKDVTISEEAREDLPRSRADDPQSNVIPMMWAVPLDGRNARGEFWSFFPTNEESGLRGILNAGWKTTIDRHSLIESTLNTELIRALADLAAESLPQLFSRENPAAHLDLLPPRDIVGPFNRMISELLYALLRDRDIAPSSTVDLCRASKLLLTPDGIAPETHELWRTAEPLPRGWVHHSANTVSRRARVRDLGAETGTLRQWLEAMMFGQETPQNCSRALKVAALLSEQPQFETQVRSIAFVLTVAKTVVPPDPNSLFLSAAEDESEDVAVVHPDVVADAESRHILEQFGIRDLDASAQMRRAADAGNWPRYWDAVRRAPRGAAAKSIAALASAEVLQVRTRTGSFSPAMSVLLPGDIVPGSDGEADAWCLDTDYHSDEVDLLQSEAGMTDGPRQAALRNETRWKGIEESIRTEYIENVRRQHGITPQRSPVIVSRHDVSGPLCILESLPPLTRARYTESLLPLALRDEDWVATHRSKYINGYPDLHKESPSRTRAREHGYLLTSLGPQPVSLAVGSEFQSWSDLFPVVQFTTEAYPFLKLPKNLDGDLARWEFAHERSVAIRDYSRIIAFYIEAARSNVRFNLIRCRIGDSIGEAVPSDVTATHDRVLFESLVRTRQPVLLTPSAEASELLVKEWQLREAAAAAFVSRFVQSAEAVPASEIFPSLAGSDIRLVACSEVWAERATEAGLEREERRHVILGRTLYYLEECTEEELAEILTREFDVAATRDFERQPDPDVSILISQVAAAETINEKLALLLGDERLKRRIPSAVIDGLAKEQPSSDEQLAAVAHALYGTAVLSVFRDELEWRGLDPPTQWAGRTREIEFVRRLGFPDAYAGARSGDIQPWIDVAGPVVLPALHDFQQVICERMSEFLREDDAARGLLSLPTGAGKTRITVDAVTGEFRRGELGGLVLWIADRDELCEQAFRTWETVWRAAGPTNGLMRLSRLWGKTNNRVVDVDDHAHVVVTTYQTLVRRMTSMPWLTTPSCIIIDEAHGSTTPSFTKILLEAGFTPQTTPTRLIGLSATPFRGDTEETVRLVNRYGKRRFDHDVFPDDDAYTYLRERGILSHVEHYLIEGSDPRLTADEIAAFDVLPDLPASVERRMAADTYRNAAIIKEIERRPPDWPILLYAISVTHAQVLAAELARRGITAACVTGESRSDARRYAINEFRANRIRVLTNYGVLTTGFDAPGVRAVFITRPVFSKSLYQQMIGRGLRGPLNGGTTTCEIVNVNDNFAQYGMTLAFSHFEYLWRRTD